MLGGAYVLHPHYALASQGYADGIFMSMYAHLDAWRNAAFFFFLNLLLMGGPNDKRGDVPVEMGGIELVIAGMVWWNIGGSIDVLGAFDFPWRVEDCSANSACTTLLTDANNVSIDIVTGVGGFLETGVGSWGTRGVALEGMGVEVVDGMSVL